MIGAWSSYSSATISSTYSNFSEDHFLKLNFVSFSRKGKLTLISLCIKVSLYLDSCDKAQPENKKEKNIR